MSKIQIAKNIIAEFGCISTTDRQVRRTNSGIAGSIATKVNGVSKFAGNGENISPLTTDEQAAELAEWLTQEEAEYAEKVWK